MNTVIISTELTCCLVEFFFILRMWRFAEKKQWAILAFIPYFASIVFNLTYIRGLSVLYLLGYHPLMFIYIGTIFRVFRRQQSTSYVGIGLLGFGMYNTIE
ncbi:hypothetical protein P691DRAFT_768138 [Macrolepiota fuliginosa MF-IS2]|uniref:Uncharacterized protein n=1 Tax=Macrolepiota fuliginosa MF-IS2 TaxID=1400762 RepID=A0A9P6BVW8_9AGAR|nr:hypothetical protein P691DRAFT_768138 [Macrolepiota fuliginosa MF-IS2]